MSAKLQTLYRDAPIGTLAPIDEAAVPDCGLAAIARLRAEAKRRHRRREFYAWPLWLSSCALLLGLFTFRQQPVILVVSFFVLRDVCIGFWLNSGRAAAIDLAIGEILKAHGAERTEHESRLRAAVRGWNADAALCAALLASSEWLTTHQDHQLQEARRLDDRRQSLLAEIDALRGDAHGAA